MKPKIDPDDPPSGWCAACQEECEGKYEDNGFSFGDRGYHEHWDLVSDCCSAEILEHNPRPEDPCEACGGAATHWYEDSPVCDAPGCAAYLAGVILLDDLRDLEEKPDA